jgi:CMP/dCMP kinase
MRRLALILFLSFAALAQKRAITHEDIWLMKRVTEPVATPDGSAPPRRLTFTRSSESSVVCPPDGSRLAFTAWRYGPGGPPCCYSGDLAESNQKHIVVAIDGPAGAGKSTIAKRLAARLGYTYIDTGAMYRAVALWALRQGVDLEDMHRMEQLALAAEIELEPGRILLNGEDVTEAIRTPEASNGASKVAVIPGVRRAMVEKQRAMGQRSSVVMEGRDIGAVVFPDAAVKVFLDANPQERVRRRFEETRTKGEAVNESALAAQMAERDKRDSTRAEAPLMQAPDATYLDSTGLGIEQVEEAVLAIVRARVSNGKEIH